ncbi:MAG: hypothetical protein KJZ54_13205, partial [Phycisphaerales bacterium]|nr:hypothetical protein [Phycisphaerales bacterium]
TFVRRRPTSQRVARHVGDTPRSRCAEDEHYLRDDGYKRRFTVERTISWIQNFRRLCIRWEKSTVLFQGYLHFACSFMLLREVLG